MNKTYKILLFVIVFVFVIASVAASWPLIKMGEKVQPAQITGKVITGNVVNDCFDSDIANGANAKFEAGYVKDGIDYSFDVCKNANTLTEQSCLGGNDASRDIPCSAGCSSQNTIQVPMFGGTLTKSDVGKCNTPTPSCIDSDASAPDQYAVKGNTTDEQGEVSIDFCVSRTNNVVEFQCGGTNGTDIVNITHTCEYRCDNGKCIPSPFTCRDSDNGNFASQVGVVKFEPQGGRVQLGIDSCTKDRNGKTAVREFYCDSATGMKDNVITCQGVCRNSTINALGYNGTAAYCEPQQLTCIDSDGRNSSVNGSVVSTDVYGVPSTGVDMCLSQKQVKEFYCENNLSKTETVNCEDICVSGKCIVRPDLCSDTDPQIRWSVKGTVNNGLSSVDDFCQDGDTLAEINCVSPKTSTAIAIKENLNCKIEGKKQFNVNFAGCRNGACVTSV